MEIYRYLQYSKPWGYNQLILTPLSITSFLPSKEICQIIIEIARLSENANKQSEKQENHIFEINWRYPNNTEAKKKKKLKRGRRTDHF